MTTTTDRPRAHRPEAVLAEAAMLTATRPNERLVVACILDEFSAQCFGPEADFVPLSPQNWEVELCASQPDLLLVESAWRGHREQWWNSVPKLVPELRAILEWCRERSVPTAFWNKEDPVHFATFLTVAAEFDTVFTTDMDCVPRYKTRLGHDRVHFLPFAAQPALHNPVESFDRVDGTAFAGAYYRRYPERMTDLDSLAGALRQRGPLAIYDRNHHVGLSEYAFPEAFHDEIVGGLAPSEIGVAYKGYTSNLNLNSVKQSQSMFARRVFELMASNTLVISNFSRGLRSMFGDLVVATDDAGEAQRLLDRVDALPHGAERLRTAALRKVFAEHTYGHRLSFIAQASGVAVEAAPPPRVLVVAQVHDPDELEIVRAAVERQSWREVSVALCLSGALGLDATADQLGAWPVTHPVLLESLEAGPVLAAARQARCDLVSVIEPADFYGRNYLTDAVQALGWSSLPVAGKARHFRASGKRSAVPRLREEEGSFVPVSGLPVRASVLRAEELGHLRAAEPLRELVLDGLSLDPFNYCRDGARLSKEALEVVGDLDVDLGHSLEEMGRHAAQATVELDESVGIPLSTLFTGLASRPGEVVLGGDPDHPTIESSLAPGTHRYLYSTARLDPGILQLDKDAHVYFECAPGLDLTLTFLFLDADGNRLGHVMAPNMLNVRVELPPGTVELCLGLRVLGPGRTTVQQFVPHHHHESSSGVLTRSRDVVITNVYPSYDNLYRNGFVHTRVRAYRSLGRSVEVLLPGRTSRARFREFEDVDVAEVPAEDLAACLASGEVDNVLVHFLEPAMWEALRSQSHLDRIVVWVHGSEVQPWWRREYNYEDERQLEAAKIASSTRISFWQKVFRDAPSNMHFVFVSRYFAEEVFEDVGVRLPDDRYSIIHNPIDTSIFTYVQKGPEQRRKVLTIRPYASRKYANDLSVEAVRILSERPGFSDIQFCFVGDGPLFDETLEPLRGMPNVEIRREFLTHSDIARMHKDYGVFLTPTRMDAQGVSRDEAMASGLVPITSAVAAIPEFVDADCGYLAEGEDAQGLAEAIWELAHDAERFATLSRAATERVRDQTASDTVIPQEIALFSGARRLEGSTSRCP